LDNGSKTEFFNILLSSISFGLPDRFQTHALTWPRLSSFPNNISEQNEIFDAYFNVLEDWIGSKHILTLRNDFEFMSTIVLNKIIIIIITITFFKM
jgi:hypothetical protein